MDDDVSGLRVMTEGGIDALWHGTVNVLLLLLRYSMSGKKEEITTIASTTTSSFLPLSTSSWLLSSQDCPETKPSNP
jgi:hypothetical protein